MTKKSKGTFWVLLHMIFTDVFTKYAWVKTFLHGFIETVSKSKWQPNELWVGQGKEFNNNLMQNWLNDNDIRMNS